MNKIECLEKLSTLLKSNILEKSQYKELLDKLCADVVINDTDVSNLRNQFQEMMCEKEDLIDNIKCDNDKLTFWAEGMFWNLWRAIGNDCIGHVSDFNIYAHYMTCEIHFRLSKSKKMMESDEQHKERLSNLEEILKKYNFDISKDNDFVFCDKNIALIKEYLSNYINVRDIEWSTFGNKIRKAKVYIKKDNNFKFPNVPETTFQSKKTDIINNEDAKKLKSLIDSATESIYFLDAGIINEDLKDSIFQSSLYEICLILDEGNEYVSRYEKDILKNKNKNKEILEKEREIANTVNYKILFKNFAKISEKFEERLYTRHLLVLKDFSIGKGISFEVSFSENFGMYEVSDAKKQSIIESYDTISYYGDEAILIYGPKTMIHLNNLAEELNCQITDINIQPYKDNQITGIKMISKSLTNISKY